MDLVYDAVHQVIICKRCQSCVGPSRAGVELHLRRKPHLLTGQRLKAWLAYTSSLTALRSHAELRLTKPKKGSGRIAHLRVWSGYWCAACERKGDEFATTHLPRMRDHMARHRDPDARPPNTPLVLWEECELQTFFAARSRVDYFVVAVASTDDGDALGHKQRGDEGNGEGGSGREEEDGGDSKEVDGCGQAAKVPAAAERLFESLESDVLNAQWSAKGGGDRIVEDFDSKMSRVPWLQRTGFPAHLAGLRDKEISSSYQLPRPDRDDEADLRRISNAVEGMLRDAYELCNDKSPECRMTQQRANILNEFYSGASGKADAFRSFKNPSTLVKYFSIFKKLLMYYFRVVGSVDGHFTRTQPKQRLPAEVIERTSKQRQAEDEVRTALRDDDEAALRHSICRLCLALICHNVGSNPYRSPVLSFCAMLGRRGDGLWHEPGNFNSHLSALTWTAQLVIFGYACRHEEEDERQIPILLSRICQKFFQQLAETPFGHILQWRLYLFKVAKAAISQYSARWSLDGQTVEYRGLELSMSQVSELVRSEFAEAKTLLYNELFFGECGLITMNSWQLEDDLDADDVGHSWLDNRDNAAIVGSSEVALLRRIRTNPELRSMFIVEAGDSESECASLSTEAIAIYEASAQEFLRRLLVLCHITSGQPLREPELLSATWKNTARLRHIFLWERLVMVHTQYHKGQQQSGVYRENIRFLPESVGNLLLDYVAYVLPLRQLFMRQRTPQGLISPYLWATLDRSVWPDGTLSLALSKACARAQVPRLHTANWRQISVSICKEKFSARDQASFDLESAGAEAEAGIEEEEQALVDMARQSNHSYRTFNRGYAGSTTLTTNALLHRAYRASQCWRAFFRFDQKPQGKRRRSDAEGPLPQELSAWKRGQVRRKAAYSESDLVAVAQRLLQTPGVRLHAPGQRDGLLAIMGPCAAEQVVIVLGTGSGKSLVFMVGAAIADAQTTILVLPTIALRQDMLRRCSGAGIRHVVWSAGCMSAAPLIIISAEAACSASFLEYAQRLIGRQQLDRVVIDECHLTITASDYRPCMSQLAWHIRQLRTQSVWLTATLPPVMEREFVKHNKLVKPRIIRESTNRPNIRYLVSLEAGPGSLIEKAAGLMFSFWSQWDIFDPSCDKAIIYCRTCAEVSELAALIGCSAYTSRCGDEEEKAAIIARWLREGENPVIVATSALGVGFDHPSVRWVVHVGAPRRLTDFSQESGRAGRDGGKALSIILLQAGWKPEDNACLSPDEQAMQLFLTQKYCSRGVLSQFLDAPSDWRWCMAGEAPCQVCQKPRKEARPSGMVFGLPAAVEIEFTGPAEVLRLDHLRDKALDEYEKNLQIVVGSCMQCRVGGRKFDHTAGQCSHRFEWIRAKEKAYGMRQKDGRQWIERYIVCWHCYQPQEICRVADPEHEETACRFRDIVMPLCYGVYHRPGGKSWLQKQLGQRVPGRLEDYMLWLGQTSSLEGNKCIRANCIAAAVLEDLLR